MSTVMIPSQEYITIQLLDVATKKPMARNVQWRTMQGYRNQGNCLVHVPSGAPPVVLEAFEELVAYNQPGYVYQLLYRPSYNVRTYAVALSIIGDPSLPQFTSLTDCLPNFREYYTLLTPTERNKLTSAWAVEGPMRRTGQITCRYDCLMHNNHASALVSIALDGVGDHGELPSMAESIRDFHDKAMYAYFLSSRVEDGKQRARWAAFFAKKTFMFLGVPAGITENGEALKVAKALGVGLMARHGRYFRLVRV
jgi:hypothetical protein